MSRTIETTVSLVEAQDRIRSLAEPGEGIEVSLADALGLVLADSIEADVDIPPFDRSNREGYAVRAAETTVGALLRVAGLRWSTGSSESHLDPGEAIRVAPGDPLPVGADAVIPIDHVRPDPETGPTRVIEIIRAFEPGRCVIRRGEVLEAGTTLARESTTVRPAMAALMATQGSVHPICHRRVRLAVLSVGGHLVRPTEPPGMHRERNAANASIVAMAIAAGAMPHDLQSVAEPDLDQALDRATSSPVIILIGRITRPTSRALRLIGFESVVTGVSMRPGGRSRYGVIRDESGRVSHHVFHLPVSPIAASVAFAMLVRPLISRLQGKQDESRAVAAIFEGAHRATGDRLRAVPATFAIGPDARARIRPIELRGPEDLPSFAEADGLALLPSDSGPWGGGELVEFVPFD